jgi:ribosomal protein L40E
LVLCNSWNYSPISYSIYLHESTLVEHSSCIQVNEGIHTFKFGNQFDMDNRNNNNIAGPRSGGKGKSQNVNSASNAEWNCTGCNTSNFPNRNSCRKCGVSKDLKSNNNNDKEVNLIRKCMLIFQKKQSTPNQLSQPIARDNEPHRKFFDLSIAKGPNGMTDFDEKSSKKFLQACLDYGDSTELIYKIDNTSQFGHACLKKSLQMDPSSTFFNKYVLPLLKKLSDDQLSVGLCKKPLNTLLYTIFDCPFFLDSMRSVLEELNDLEIVARFLLSVISAPGEDAAKARTSPIVRDIAMKLQEISDNTTKAHKTSEMIIRVLAGATVRSNNNNAIDISNFPGDRHDNDFADFRSIAIIPTAAEVICKETPYLPMADDVLSGGQANMLDRFFRLLRHDFVAPLREELQVSKGPESKRSQWRTFKEVSFDDLVVEEKSFSCFNVSFKQQPSAGATPEKRKAYWDDHKSLLPHLSLVCFVRDGLPLRFGMVINRNTVHLSHEDRATIGISIKGKGEVEATISELKLQIPGTVMIQVSASYFAFEPILKCLQSMAAVPLEEELVNLKSTEAPTKNLPIVQALHITDDTDDIAPYIKAKKPIILENSQRLAILNLLSNRVGLVQGPPGTGKSFVGTLAAKIIHDNTNEVILCVCYTNHALDQFLEDLLDIGIPATNIVRIGGSQKVSAKIQPLMLPHQNSKFTRAESNRFYYLKGKITDLIIEIRKKLAGLNQQINWTTIKDFFEQEFMDEEIEQFELPDSNENIVGKKGKTVTEQSLWTSWTKGEQRFPPLSFSPKKDLWKMSKIDRQNLLDEWISAMRGPLIEELADLTKKFDDTQISIQDLRSGSKMTMLATKRIIGCTTTGAAKNKDLLDTVHAGVLLVEEAGEILEPHILSSLNARTKQLIMIGDHKQLRPKVNVYDLMVESKTGYDLNQSLFERLILAGFPYATLESQHRMHPEISHNVRVLTYPNLRDSAKVSQSTN